MSTFDTQNGFVSICTMHLAKGLEFRAVVVMACDDEVIPSQQRIESVADEADLEEVYETERHLLYVACTRARDHLLVTSGNVASEFIDDLNGSICSHSIKKIKMYLLNRLILIDSYKPGELVEIRLDGHTNLNGVNGAGKTTLLRLVPLFFGERPGRLVPKSRVTDSFSKHYLPNESSYIIFEYQRHEQTCMSLMYASPNEDGVCYRFVDKGFDKDDFIETRRDGTFYPVSCRNLRKTFSNAAR